MFAYSRCCHVVAAALCAAAVGTCAAHVFRRRAVTLPSTSTHPTLRVAAAVLGRNRADNLVVYGALLRCLASVVALSSEIAQATLGRRVHVATSDGALEGRAVGGAVTWQCRGLDAILGLVA